MSNGASGRLDGRIVADRANTVVELADGSLVNFLYHVDGLRSFEAEYRQALRLRWLGFQSGQRGRK